MKIINAKLMNLSLMAFAAVALSACGSGGRVVKSLTFANETIDSMPYTGFDAKLNLGDVDLPYAQLPVFTKTNKVIGYIGTGGQQISLRLSVQDLAGGNLELDAATLPNGRPLPISLPADIIPMAIPIKGSNAKVYFALGNQNIMAGVGLTLKVTSTNGELRNWDDYLGIPANIFFPVTINSTLKATAGVFTGEKFGVGVFAVQTLKQQTSGLFGGIAAFSKTGKVSGGKEFFGVKEQQPSSRNMYKINSALEDVRTVSID